MVKLKKVCCIIISFVLMMSIVACGKKSNGVTIWWEGTKAMQEIINNAIAKYKQCHADFNVNIVYKSWDAFDAYKYALNDEKTRPDIAVIDHVYVQALANDNQLLSLSLEDNIKNKFPEEILSSCSYKGNSYALPLSANTVVLMYNKDILFACGLTAPTKMAELKNCLEVVKAKGYTAFAQPIDDFSAMEFTSYVARHGGSLVSEDCKAVKFNSSEVKSALLDWIELSTYANITTFEEDKFYNGKVAFCEMGSWALNKVKGSNSRFNCGFSEMVTIKADLPNYSGLGLYSLVIPTKTKYSEQATDFAKFLSTDTQFQLALGKQKNLFPVTKEALNDSYYTGDEALSVYANQLLNVKARPGTPIWPDMEKAITDMLLEAKREPISSLDSIINKYQQSVQSATDRVLK